MKAYLVDTNIFLRFILQDNKKFAQVAKKYFLKAKEGKVKLIFIPEVILEINYVLRKVYQLSRKEVAKHLSTLVKTPYFDIRNRDILIKALKIYSRINLDLADIILYVSAKKEGAHLLSFDKDFKKIPK